jgi:hypothetical protein
MDQLRQPQKKRGMTEVIVAKIDGMDMFEQAAAE